MLFPSMLDKKEMPCLTLGLHVIETAFRVIKNFRSIHNLLKRTSIGATEQAQEGAGLNQACNLDGFLNLYRGAAHT
jgi:hypothetical protein